jgi:hypothetical protein
MKKIISLFVIAVLSVTACQDYSSAPVINEEIVGPQLDIQCGASTTCRNNPSQCELTYIRGRVTELTEHGIRGVAGIDVCIWNEQAFATTDSRGMYAFEGLQHWDDFVYLASMGSDGNTCGAPAELPDGWIQIFPDIPVPDWPRYYYTLESDSPTGYDGIDFIIAKQTE